MPRSYIGITTVRFSFTAATRVRLPYGTPTFLKRSLDSIPTNLSAVRLRRRPARHRRLGRRRGRLDRRLPAFDDAILLQQHQLERDGAADLVFAFGAAGDRPVAGDWNGANNAPNSGVNDPADGSSRVHQTQVFTTTCSDPDGWHDISTIDFRIIKSNGQGNGLPIALWVQFDEGSNLVRFYNPDSQTWAEGTPGSNVVLSSTFAEINLSQTSVLGSGPTGPSVQITWSITFKDAAVMNNYKQYLKITDDAGLTTGFDKVGSWSVTR